VYRFACIPASYNPHIPADQCQYPNVTTYNYRDVGWGCSHYSAVGYWPAFADVSYFSDWSRHFGSWWNFDNFSDTSSLLLIISTVLLILVFLFAYRKTVKATNRS